MLVILLFCFIFVHFSNVDAANTTSDGRAFTTDCTNYFPYTDMASLPYTVTVVDPNTGSGVGLGMVVNVYWFLTTQRVRETIEPIWDQVKVFQDVYDVSLILDNTRYVYVTFMTSANNAPGILSQYVLMKVCPIFMTPDEFVTIPPNSNALDYNIGDTAYVFVSNNGGGEIEYFCIKIVADSECSALSSEYDPAEHYCIKDVDGNVNVATEEIPTAGFVLINEEFRGFIMATNNVDTAIVQKVEANAQWIRDNSPPIPYYP